MKTFLALVISAAVLYGFGHLINRAWDIETCARITEQAQQGYTHFYITQSEADTCTNRGLPVPNARIVR